MGTEQSKEFKKQSKDEIAREEVERMLAAQKRIYDAKVQQVIAETARKTAASTQLNAREEMLKEQERILTQQRRLYEEKIKALTQTSASPQTTSMERNRTPYSYAKEDLERAIKESNAESNSRSNSNTARSSVNANNSHTPSPSRDSGRNEDFVFVNNDVRTERPSPSAPSAPFVTTTAYNAGSARLNPSAPPAPSNAQAFNNAGVDSTSREEALAEQERIFNALKKQKQLYEERKKAFNQGNSPSLQPTRFNPSPSTASSNAQNAKNAGTNSNFRVFTNTNVVDGTNGTYSSGLNVESSAMPAPTATKDTTRGRSRSRPRSVVRKADGVNCPTCKNRFTMYIYQCNQGHSSCQECKKKRLSCGICRNPITDLRNITLEAYIAEIKIPCPNDGCVLNLKTADMDGHLKECPFGQMLCPLAALGRCSWKGKLSEMSSHFDNLHPQHRSGDVDKELFLFNLEFNQDVIHFIDLGIYKFVVCIMINATEKKINMTVQLMGTKCSASKWTYELHVYNKNNPRRKYQYSDVCHSTITPLKDIYKEADCAVIPLSYAKTFLNNNSLSYKFFIKKFENKKEFNYHKYGARPKC